MAATDFANIYALLTGKLLSLLLGILLLILFRILLGRFLGGLVKRGVIHPNIRGIVLRIIDWVILIVIIVAVLSIFTEVATLSLPILLAVIILLVINWRTIREFTSYLELNILRHIYTGYYEISLPTGKTIRGKIAETTPTSSIVEDVYGYRYHVTNTLLLESVFKEVAPGVIIRLYVEDPARPAVELVEDIIDKLLALNHPIFRFDVKKTVIEGITSNKWRIVLHFIASSPVIRPTDIASLLSAIRQQLAEYKIDLEVC